MLRSVVVIAAAVTMALAPVDAQRRPARKAPARQAPLTKSIAAVKCPALLGTGVKTARIFCDVPAGRDPADGVIVTIPPHTGTATLSFDLHARHTYSEAETRAGRAFSQYMAVIGVLSMKGDLISRAAIQTEFRSAASLFDRISGGAGPNGLKAVAPVGVEQVYVTVPAGLTEVSLLGETLDASTPAGHETVVLPGRPVAIVSNVQVEYRKK
ncbi:MAG TPA: hypothetical protein VFK20_11580 [Vicinamibacterales bacterium]|nr:hypothetical protein [Vicinamibacterales bacterium]